ncbi:hypothetical protein [Chromatocurvus halotolerans]|uniref:DUF4345 domain-containing protein n=1 Tax=Chromatocurvus halotolerans TaxID=1132028 RepID=A0A4R2KLV9_9GAMM|nr:hypothetical protein [Chromatocurvus halotolerans]TCO71008.1 hypothetical protein EV688_12421 [Chromatocurvus halotolerans]
MIARTARLILWLLAAVTLFLGLRWVVEPEAAAASLGMPLLEGLARSTQIGDISAFFFGIAAMLMLGLQTGRDSWLHAAAIFFGLAAIMRTLAWLLHDATFAGPLIAVEVALALIILLAAKMRRAA